MVTCRLSRQSTIGARKTRLIKELRPGLALCSVGVLDISDRCSRAVHTLGNRRIGYAGLIRFAFDIKSLSLVGVDNETTGGSDDEPVTLSAYDAAGNLIGESFSNKNLPGSFDQTPASIAFAGIRYAAFNDSDTPFGCYGIDDLVFTPASQGRTPEPATSALLLIGALGLAARRALGSASMRLR